MRPKDNTAIDKANETIRRNREKRLAAEKADNKKPDAVEFDIANCANAFSRNGHKVEHIFDKIF